ncbi:nucleotidyltransferase family protein [Oceaniglobus ichthyenteri]|uniref:nucleotidyltransferase family protein n=1 Tax=Oceaniglobus ichthyenteri TaxID=2136177 RepID=UPI000D36CB9B|nr:nucleotidyltransferase family protein [Oceaniglobus ichthyenteri]
MRNSPTVIMLFAAGFGTRMAPLSDYMPKPLIPVAGRPLIDHALALTDGFARRVVNLHYKGEMLADHLAAQDVALSWERAAILDTGGGLRQALPLLGAGPVATLNTDAVWTGPNPMDTLRAAWAPDRMDALLLTIPVARAHGRAAPGDFTLAQDGRLIRQGNQVYTGAQIIKTERLADIADAAFSLNRLWDMFAATGRLHGVEHPGGWCDVGHPDGIAIAETMLAQHNV